MPRNFDVSLFKLFFRYFTRATRRREKRSSFIDAFYLFFSDSQMTDTELMSPSSQEAMFNQHSFKDGGKGSYRGTSRGNAEFSNRRNANWVDDGNFEMDKLHLQYIEKSTTEVSGW